MIHANVDAPLAWAFSSNDFLPAFSFLPIADETKPSFQATTTPTSCGAFSIAIAGLLFDCSCSVAFDMNVVAGRDGGRM